MMKRNSSAGGAAVHVFIGVVSLLGLAAVAYSLTELIRSGSWSWILLAGLTAAASSLGFKLAGPGGRSGNLTSSVGDCFMVAGFLLYGPAAAAVVAAVEAITTNIGFRVKSPERWLFNIGQYAVSAFAAAHFFYFATGLAAPVNWAAMANPWTLLVFAVALAMQLTLNSGLIVTAMALKEGRPLGAFWKKCTLGVGPAALLNAIAGLVIVSCANSIHLAAAVILLGLSLYYIGQISLIFGGDGKPWKVAGDLYLATIVAGGLAATVFSVYETAMNPSLEWAALLGLTALASLRPSYLPQVGLREGGMVITFSTVFVFVGLLVAGPAAAVTMSLVEAGVSAWKSGAAIRDPKKVLFNLFQLPLAMYLAGGLFYWLCPSPQAQSALLPAVLAVSSLLYIAINAAVVSGVVFLTTGSHLRLGDSLGLISAAVRQLSEAAVATVIFVSWLSLAPWALFWIALTGGLLFLSCNMNLWRFRTAQQSTV